ILVLRARFGSPWTDAYFRIAMPFAGNPATVKIWRQGIDRDVPDQGSKLTDRRSQARDKPERRLTMNAQSRRILFAAGLITAALTSGAIGQQDEKLGKVVFPISCDPNVQAEFNRGVAMLHSYWFLKARHTFEGILQQDPTCAMAHGGVAMDFLGNTWATTPTRADSEAAWDALEKARVAGAKTQRERDWIEALSA